MKLSDLLIRFAEIAPDYSPWANPEDLKMIRMAQVDQYYLPCLLRLCQDRCWKIEAKYDGELWTVAINTGISFGDTNIFVTHGMANPYRSFGMALLTSIYSVLNYLSPVDA